jgi:hypothetical protein
MRFIPTVEIRMEFQKLGFEFGFGQCPNLSPARRLSGRPFGDRNAKEHEPVRSIHPQTVKGCDGEFSVLE